MSSKKRKYELKARAERQQDTRRRIVEATIELHQELGPARTTVVEVARRAGVNRLTVYNHFPDEAELFAACQGQFLAQHPPPDFAEALALDEPAARVRAALCDLYGSYRVREPMTAKILRDRAALPALDALMERTMDAQLAELVNALARPFKARGKAAQRLRAVLAVAVDFGTWQRLDRAGLDDAAAADLMADLAAGTGTGSAPGPRRERGRAYAPPFVAVISRSSSKVMRTFGRARPGVASIAKACSGFVAGSTASTSGSPRSAPCAIRPTVRG
jgi:AcrR family transcriptional regulator